MGLNRNERQVLSAIKVDYGFQNNMLLTHGQNLTSGEDARQI
jgi:hypothetical protein